jgi:hypothetical protein
VSPLVKLANILECSVENLIGSHKEHVQIKPKYADIYDDCSIYIEAYMERNISS